MDSICRICGNSEGLIHHHFSEKMMGTGDKFDYFQCPSCGCLQISRIPENLSNYYSDDYYSYRPMRRFEDAPLRMWVDTHRINYGLTGRDIAGYIFSALTKPLEYLPWIKTALVNQESKILDVGCGQGRLLLRMALGGFKNLTGVDPFIERDIKYPNGVTIWKADLSAMAAAGEKFDFIMLHHSFEHMPDQFDALKTATKLLNENGVILLRVPLCDSYAWKHYQDNWVQLDAPRHLYLHSRRSIALLAENCGLVLEQVIDDSSKFQFAGSELYKMGIPLSAPKRKRNIFTPRQLRDFSTHAEQLNSVGEGDQAAFYLRKASC